MVKENHPQNLTLKNKHKQKLTHTKKYKMVPLNSDKAWVTPCSSTNKATGSHCSQTAFGWSEQPSAASGIVKAGDSLGSCWRSGSHGLSGASFCLQSRCCLSLVQWSAQSHDLEKQFCWSLSVRTEIKQGHTLVGRLQKSYQAGKDHGFAISFVFYSLISTATAMQPS